MSTIITIDGPSGVGKTTVAKLVAEELGLPYLPLGKLYRAVGWTLKNEGIPLENKAAVEERIKNLNLEVQDDGLIISDGKDITDLLAEPSMGMAAAVVAQYPGVRIRLTEIQRQFGLGRGCVIEGRSTAIEIFPEATLKVWLTASLEERMRRKPKAGTTLKTRDAIDQTRQDAPMEMAEQAIVIDSTTMSADETAHRIVELYKNIRR